MMQTPTFMCSASNIQFDSELNTDNNNDMEPFEIITSYKGRSQILYKSKVYNKIERRSAKKEKTRDTIYWKCNSVSNRCTGSLTTDINSSVIFASNENHHPDCEPMSEKSLQYRKILTSVKRKATGDFLEPPGNLTSFFLLFCRRDPEGHCSLRTAASRGLPHIFSIALF